MIIPIKERGSINQGSGLGSVNLVLSLSVQSLLQAMAKCRLRKFLCSRRFAGFGNPKDPSIQIIPTLGPEVCKSYLHWAIWIPRESQ